jgi:hypothetical protein
MEVVDLTDHRFDGIFVPFAHPGIGKSARSDPRFSVAGVRF